MASDPTAMLRAWLGEWDRLAKGAGTDALRPSEDAGMAMQAVLSGAMDRALAATNLPSRADLAELSIRVGRIEDSLARIEAALAARPAAAPPRSRRTGKPPA